jgi:hypothetical protein
MNSKAAASKTDPAPELAITSGRGSLEGMGSSAGGAS